MTLEARNLSFRYVSEGRLILNGFSFTMESGERLGLDAPSGLGKTTLCKILAGYEKPDGGEVLIGGAPLPAKGRSPVQMIWQHPELAINPRMRMRDVLAEGGSIAPEVISGLGIERDWLSRWPTELSGGELQRFCIARALGEGTRFVLADEISTMLDLITQSQIWSFLLEETARRDIGLLAISHSPALLDIVCTRRIALPVA